MVYTASVQKTQRTTYNQPVMAFYSSSNINVCVHMSIYTFWATTEGEPNIPQQIIFGHCINIYETYIS